MSKPWKNLLAGLALLASGLYGGHSLLTGQAARPLDVALDALGIGLLVLAAVQYSRRARGRRTPPPAQ
ncbi:MAG: hypothetical protein BWZ02_01117 [Lentisphaerae bacterium ADurb.BinA184]|nr:MAG: hypothetical protein BWZ02_01117 [Lentisphaerae bacterium ADurb.BinA184]